jgi:hypothetical protein
LFRFFRKIPKLERFGFFGCFGSTKKEPKEPNGEGREGEGGREMDVKWKGKGRERERKGKEKGKGREREGKGKRKGKGREREGKGKRRERECEGKYFNFYSFGSFRNGFEIPKQTERSDFILSEKIPKKNRNCQCFGLFRFEPKEKKSVSQDTLRLCHPLCRIKLAQLLCTSCCAACKSPHA